MKRLVKAIVVLISGCVPACVLFKTFAACDEGFLPKACIGSLEDQATFAADMSRCWPDAKLCIGTSIV